MNCKPTKDENTFSAIQEKESKLNNEIITGLNEQHETIRVTISLPSSEKKPEDNSK